MIWQNVQKKTKGEKRTGLRLGKKSQIAPKEACIGVPKTDHRVEPTVISP